MRLNVARSLLAVTVSILGLAALTSCGPDGPPATGGGNADTTLTNPPADAPQGPSARQAASPIPGAPTAGNRGASADNSPVAPPDAQWTLLAYTQSGPTHVTDANALKNGLIQKTGRNSWYVIHSRDDSNVYFGYYRAFEDPKDPVTKVAQADLQFVKQIQWPDLTGQLVTPFERCGFVPIAAPDPVEPPNWNLFNKDRDKAPKDPTRAYWSLQIMAFRANPLRKAAAVQAVEALRKDGVDAYYYHGDTISSVCVGAWPIDAIEAQTNHGDHTVARQDDTVMVLPEGTLPPRGTKFREYDDEGHKIVPVAPVLHILDAGMKEMIKKFPNHWVNYEINRHRTVDGGYRDDPSFLVVIPRATGNGYYDSSEVTPADLAAADQEPWHNRSQANANILGPSDPARTVSANPPDSIGASSPPPPPPSTPGVGHLRCLGD